MANELVSNFSSFSAMTLFDRVNNQRQYNELLSGFYADDDGAGLDLGHLASTDYMLMGDITRTSTGYVLQLVVNKNNDKTTIASYSGPVSIVELDNLIGVRRASLDLLEKMGIQLTTQAQTELTRAATADHVNALTSMARGISAQRQGTEVAALTYFFQAAAFDASLVEVVNRTNVLSSNISTGNIGANIRNDFAWHDDWRAKLTETETLMNDMLRDTNPQRSIWYSNNVTEHEAARDHVRRTTELRIETVLHTHAVFPVSVQRTVQAVYDGLQTTRRAQAWRFDNWPRQGVTNANPFNSRWGSMISIAFEVLNGQGQVIGKQTVELDSRYSFNGTRLEGPGTAYTTVRFTGVRGDDIHYPLAVRVAAINGQPPEAAGISQIAPLSAQQIQDGRTYTIYNGVIQPSSNDRNLGAITIPVELWGERVTAIASGSFESRGLTSVIIFSKITSIGASTFAGNQLTSVSIPSSVTSIGANAFARNRLTSVTIPEGVTSIGDRAFADNHWTTGEYHHGLSRVVIANSVTSIGQEAFASHWTTRHYNERSNQYYTLNHWLVMEVRIGANVNLGNNAIGNGFEKAYIAAGKQAGAYKAKNSLIDSGITYTSSGRWERFEDAESMQQANVERAEARYRGMKALFVIGIIVFIGGSIWAWGNLFEAW